MSEIQNQDEPLSSKVVVKNIVSGKDGPCLAGTIDMTKSDEFTPVLYNTLLDSKSCKMSPPLRLVITCPRNLVNPPVEESSSKKRQAAAMSSELFGRRVEIEVSFCDGSHIKQFEVDPSTFTSRQVSGTTVCLQSPRIVVAELVNCASTSDEAVFELHIERKFPLSKSHGEKTFLLAVFLDGELLALSPPFIGRSNQPKQRVLEALAEATPVKRKRRPARVVGALTADRARRFQEMAAILCRASQDDDAASTDSDVASQWSDQTLPPPSSVVEGPPIIQPPDSVGAFAGAMMAGGGLSATAASSSMVGIDARQGLYSTGLHNFSSAMSSRFDSASTAPPAPALASAPNGSLPSSITCTAPQPISTPSFAMGPPGGHSISNAMFFGHKYPTASSGNVTNVMSHITAGSSSAMCQPPPPSSLALHIPQINELARRRGPGQMMSYQPPRMALTSTNSASTASNSAATNSGSNTTAFEPMGSFYRRSGEPRSANGAAECLFNGNGSQRPPRDPTATAGRQVWRPSGLNHAARAGTGPSAAQSDALSFDWEDMSDIDIPDDLAL